MLLPDDRCKDVEWIDEQSGYIYISFVHYSQIYRCILFQIGPLRVEDTRLLCLTTIYLEVCWEHRINVDEVRRLTLNEESRYLI